VLYKEFKQLVEIQTTSAKLITNEKSVQSGSRDHPKLGTIPGYCKAQQCKSIVQAKLKAGILFHFPDVVEHEPYFNPDY
jgi:hypothetical protein